MIDGVYCTPLKIIPNPKGNVRHGIKSSDLLPASIEEVYFSCLKKNQTKGWRKHLRVTMNLICVHGAVKIVVYDKRKGSKTFDQFNKFILKIPNSYFRLMIPPLLWVAMENLDNEESILMNVINFEHESKESVVCNLNEIPYPYEKNDQIVKI